MATPPPAAKAARRSSSPALLLLGLQILTRLFTFVLNQALIRFSNPALYGAAHIHLELLLSLVLFLSREGIRAASLRQDDRDAKGAMRSNLPLLPIPLGLVLGACAVPLFLRSSPALATQPYFSTVVHLYLASSLLELLSEPLYLHALSPAGGRDIALRVRAEGSAAIAKGVITLAAVIGVGQQKGLLAFGLGQASYGATILATFVSAYIARIGARPTLALYAPAWPTKSATKDASAKAETPVRSQTTRLAVALFFQSILKHLLTEADKLAVSQLASLEDQGGYALGTNYASLPLRLLFQPLEESSRFQFSKSLGSVQAPKAADDKDVDTSREKQNSSPAMKQSLRLLASLLHLHTFLALLLLAFLPPLSAPFIHILSGAQWATTSAPRTLAAFAFFLPAAGWSGILEGFLQSTASERQLKTYNKVIIASSLTFGGAVWALTRKHTLTAAISTEEALVCASTLAMGVRALWGWRYSKAFFETSPQGLALRRLLPSTATTLAIVGAGIALRAIASGIDIASKSAALRLYAPLIGTAATVGVAVLGVIFTADRTSLLDTLRAIRGQDEPDAV